jgi:hypothetical protein
MVIKNEMEDEKNKKMLIYFFITSTCFILKNKQFFNTNSKKSLYVNKKNGMEEEGKNYA